MRRQLATLLRRIADRLYKEPVIVSMKSGVVTPTTPYDSPYTKEWLQNAKQRLIDRMNRQHEDWLMYGDPNDRSPHS